MDIRCKNENWSGKPAEKRLDSFLHDKILHEERYNSTREVPLQEQPQKVMEAMGRMLELFVKKGLLTEDEFFRVIGIDDYDRKNYEIVREKGE